MIQRRTKVNGMFVAIAATLLGCLAGAFFTQVSTARADALSAAPALYPDFSWNQRDYVVRCQATRGMPRVKLTLPANWTARVSGAPAKSGTFSTKIKKRAGAGTSIAIRRPGAGITRFQVRCLPKDFPRFVFQRYRAGGPRLTFAQVGGNYAVFFDRAGTPVWWMKNGIPPLHPQVLRDGTLSWLVKDHSAREANGGIRERFAWGIRSLNGKLIRLVRGANGLLTDAHELMLLRNGNYLLDTFPRDRGLDLRPFGGPANAVGRGNMIQEVTPKGRLVWKWNAGSHVDLAETGRWWKMIVKRRQPLDYLHFNSAEPVGNAMVMSFRHLDAVYKIDRASGKILWKLGGTPTEEQLQIRNDPHGDFPFGGQHDARVNKQGILSVFDNATNLGRSPRVVRYRINEKTRTATMISSFSDRQVPLSTCCGSAEELPNGQWLVNWGGLGSIRKPGIRNLVGAYTREGRPIFRLWTYDKHMYRAQPVAGPYPSLVQLRRVMDSRIAR